MAFFKQYTGSSILDMKVDSQGNSYIIGVHSGTNECFLSKVSLDGTIIFSKEYDFEIDYGPSVKMIIVNDSNLIIKYTSYSSTQEETGEAIVAKVSVANGEILWAKLIENTNGAHLVDESFSNYGNSHFIIMHRDENNEGGFLQKFDLNGNIVQSKSMISVFGVPLEIRNMAVNPSGTRIVLHTGNRDLTVLDQELRVIETAAMDGFFTITSMDFANDVDVFILSYTLNAEDRAVNVFKVNINLFNSNSSIQGINIPNTHNSFYQGTSLKLRATSENVYVCYPEYNFIEFPFSPTITKFDLDLNQVWSTYLDLSIPTTNTLYVDDLKFRFWLEKQNNDNLFFYYKNGLIVSQNTLSTCNSVDKVSVVQNRIFDFVEFSSEIEDATFNTSTVNVISQDVVLQSYDVCNATSGTSSDDFVTTWRTTTNDETITIPTLSTVTYNYSVDWGDGTIESGFTGVASHIYQIPGDYIVRISGDFTQFRFGLPEYANMRHKIRSVDQWGSTVWGKFREAFSGCSNVRILANDAPDLSAMGGTQTVYYMFNDATSFNEDISHWDMSAVTDLDAMFIRASTFNQDVSSWDTSNMINMRQAFREATSFNQDISSWDVTNVTDMRGMFQDATSFNQNLGAWDIKQVTMMDDFMQNSGISIDNYDATLIGWGQLSLLQNNVTIQVDSQYCIGETARDSIIENYGWAFQDEGIHPDCDSEMVLLSYNTSLQSPNFYLQATGSDGTDSTEGRHLRWMLRGALGDKHLPKGNLATNTTVNFNKPNDFVKIYKSSYVQKRITLDFLINEPEVVDNSNYLWIYRIEDKEFYVYFKNTEKYNQVLQNTNPINNPISFLTNYDGELLEIENKEQLFFATIINFTQVGLNSTYSVETLSVNENTLVANRVVSNRQTFDGAELNGQVRLICENGRSIRGKYNNCKIVSISFEYYEDTINKVNNTFGWEVLGEFALSQDETIVFNQLEPNEGDVNKSWERFNDNAFVNIANYQNKWNATPEEEDRNIKQVVGQYINLSNNVNNPTAIEDVPLGNDPTDPDDVVQISNLDLLNVASYDYHIARMLGLGILDVQQENSVFAESHPTFLYVAEYVTFGDLEDGLGAREVHHLSMSLPTSNEDNRLPIPVQIDTITPGAFIGTDSDEPSAITDQDGYTHDGLSRYVSLYAEESQEDYVNVPFFNTTEQIDLGAITYPIYAGLEYKLGNEDWQKPELAHDTRYLNAVPDGENAHFETRFINIPGTQAPFYVHRQNISGTHTYKSYGINWFSRSQLGEEKSIETLLTPTNPLLPPSSTNALLVRRENPLLLTSAEEQDRLVAISANDTANNVADKTLIRLSFNYHAAQELKSYQVPLDSTISDSDLINTEILFPNDQEIFADYIDVFFRNEVPNNVTGKVMGDIIDDTTNELLSIIETEPYIITSNGTTIVPVVTPGTEDNFVGGVLIQGSQRFMIHEVSQGTNGPVFTVYKKTISESIVNGGAPSDTTEALEIPVVEGDGLFMAIENMQTPASWGTPNPLGMQVEVGPSDEIHRELLTFTDSDGVETRQIEKTKGIWDTATVTPVLEPGYDSNGVQGEYHQGLYKFEFDSKTLDQHSQFSTDGNSVEWFRGSIRVFSNDSYNGGTPNKPRRVLSILKIENIVTADTVTEENIVVYAHDPSFIQGDVNYDQIQTGANVSVNFYPGYKVYLYADPAFNLTEDGILPAEGEGMRNSIFGFRSKDSDGACDGPNTSCVSKISTPNVLFAQELIEPLPPQEPLGGTFATRPDFFGRSTFTFTTQYSHKPHGVLFYRSNEEALLNALYTKATMLSIREALKLLGGNDEVWVNDRWKNFLDFEALETNGDYSFYPPEEDAEHRYKFPHPDKPAFFDWANQVRVNLGLDPLDVGPDNTVPVGDSRILNFVKGAIYSAFVPLTEVPVIYEHIQPEPYQPQSKKQVIRDRNGGVLSPTDPEFDMAPMMKTIGTNPHETLYTDFNLDGTSNNLYFYGVKELGTQLKMSAFSPFLGPIKLVNTNAPEQPEVKRIMPILENQVLGITPKIQLEVNAYPEVQNIQRLTVYRTTNRLKAQSVRTMDVAKVIDLTQEEYAGQSVLKVYDDFSDLAEVPYGQGLYYRITVSRAVTYTDKDSNLIDDFAPSQASKIVATMMVEVVIPASPELTFEANISSLSNNIATNVVLTAVRFFWEKQAYNAKYHLYKMNSQGNWYKIYELQTNEDQIEVSLSDTDAESPLLLVQDADGVNRYHHFKVITENTSGMLSTEEKILTLPDTVIPSDGTSFPATGIGSMDVGTTFTLN